MRPDEEMADLLQKSLAGPILESTTCHQDDGEFEVVTSRPRLSENLPMVISRIFQKINFIMMFQFHEIFKNIFIGPSR